jgi:hypothetical protein
MTPVRSNSHWVGTIDTQPANHQADDDNLMDVVDYDGSDTEIASDISDRSERDNSRIRDDLGRERERDSTIDSGRN